MIQAKIIEDSINRQGKRLTTFVLRYPRFVHAELLTHRQFSRNASSSRAIPAKKLINQAINDIAWPVHWGKNQPGMQARQELSKWRIFLIKKLWKMAAFLMVCFAHFLNKLALHKQVVNRILEPFTHISTIVTATEFDNFFALRTHPDAQPEIKVLAELMLVEYNNSKPKLILQGEWHLPFVSSLERHTLDLETQLKCSVARCARVSYLNHEGKLDINKDIGLHDDLYRDGHVSPFEHQATPLGWVAASGNFVGWKQYRKTLANEVRVFDYTKVLS